MTSDLGVPTFTKNVKVGQPPAKMVQHFQYAKQFTCKISPAVHGPEAVNVAVVVVAAVSRVTTLLVRSVATHAHPLAAIGRPIIPALVAVLPTFSVNAAGPLLLTIEAPVPNPEEIVGAVPPIKRLLTFMPADKVSGTPRQLDKTLGGEPCPRM